MSALPERIVAENADCTVFRDGPSWNGQPAAAIGQFTCADAATGSALLRKVLARLSGEGVAAALGPMDGDTWRSYRAVTESDGTPAFLMEPTAGPHVAQAFQAAGFQPVSRYLSARASLDDAIGDGPPQTLDGLSVSAWDGTNAEGLIGQLFAMSAQSFAGNAFYKPIARGSFIDLYRPVIKAIDPRLVLFARDPDGALQGFVFAMPNHLEGARPSTVILKTYASRKKGVGRALADHLHRSARDLGYAWVIHALMHEDNTSRASSERFRAQTFRRYGLFGARLA